MLRLSSLSQSKEEGTDLEHQLLDTIQSAMFAGKGFFDFDERFDALLANGTSFERMLALLPYLNPMTRLWLASGLNFHERHQYTQNTQKNKNSPLCSEILVAIHTDINKRRFPTLPMI